MKAIGWLALALLYAGFAGERFEEGNVSLALVDCVVALILAVNYVVRVQP